MFFTFPDDFKEKEITSGITLKAVWGKRIMLSYVTFQANSAIPVHSHPHEQTSQVLEGEVEITINGERRLCQKGDAFTIPSDAEHSAATTDKSAIVLDAFNPHRQDYM